MQLIRFSVVPWKFPETRKS